MNKFLLYLILASIVILSGCSCICPFEGSIYPLSDKNNSKLDKRFFGTWKGLDTDSVVGYIKISKKTYTKKIKLLVTIDPGDLTKKYEIEGFLFSTYIDNQCYINFQFDKITNLPDPEDLQSFVLLNKFYLIFKYKFINDDEVSLFEPKSEIIEKAIASGALKTDKKLLSNINQKEKNTSDKNILISSTSEEMRKFLLSINAKTAFEHFLTLKKVKK